MTTQILTFIIFLLAFYSATVTILWYQIRHDPIRKKMTDEIETLKDALADANTTVRSLIEGNRVLLIQKNDLLSKMPIGFNGLLEDNKRLTDLLNMQDKTYDTDMSIILLAISEDDDFTLHKKSVELMQKRSKKYSLNIATAVEKAKKDYITYKESISPLSGVNSIKVILDTMLDSQISPAILLKSNLTESESYQKLITFYKSEGEDSILFHVVADKDQLEQLVRQVAFQFPEDLRLLPSDLELDLYSSYAGVKTPLETVAAIMEFKRINRSFLKVGESMNVEALLEHDRSNMKLTISEVESFIFSNPTCLSIFKDTSWEDNIEDYEKKIVEVINGCFHPYFAEKLIAQVGSDESREALNDPELNRKYQDPVTSVFMARPYHSGFYMLIK